MQRKYLYHKKNLNVKLIKLSYLCQGTVVYLTLITLLSSYLETVVTEIEMKRQNDEKKIIWVRLPYFWQAGDKIKKSCFRKVQKCLTKNVCFFPCYETKKPAMFTSAKDFIPTLQKLNVVYCSKCPECNELLHTYTSMDHLMINLCINIFQNVNIIMTPPI